MKTDSVVRPDGPARTLHAEQVVSEEPIPKRPLVSVIIPAFNEGAMMMSTLTTVCRYLESLENQFRWEILVVNDGSVDNTAEATEAFARMRRGVRVIHHSRNCGLGQALRTGFNSSLGKYVVVLDCDLSYSPEHIGRLLDEIQRREATIVVASPYANGGRVSDVPWLRHTMSVWANRFLASVARCSLSTLTGMVRVYDGQFIRGMSLRSQGQEISPEIIYKSVLLGAQIEEIPAHLDWNLQRSEGQRRTSSMKLMPHIISTVFSGFIFRPFIFFLLPGFSLFILGAYINVWMLVHFYDQYKELTQYDWFFTRASVAVAQAYQAFPHTFIVGGLSLMVAIQLISLGVLALQSKQYFEEIFHLASTICKDARDRAVTEWHSDRPTT